MEITLNFKEYSRQTGAVDTWIDGYEINVHVEQDGELSSRQTKKDFSRLQQI